MTDDEVLEAAATEGFDLHERITPHTGHEAWGWHRGDDDRWPCYLERRLAISWMRDRLRSAIRGVPLSRVLDGATWLDLASSLRDGD